MKLSSTEIKRIREVFVDEYKDFGIYRWMNRNKKVLKASFGIGFVAVLSIAILGQSWPLAIWAFAFIGIVAAGGIDHFIIGFKLKKILTTLGSEGIDISPATLLDLCSDILPE